MNAPKATPRQIGFIHSLAAKAHMDDETRRDFMLRETGQRSSRDITVVQAADVIDKLKALAPSAVAGLDSPIAKKLRALWIAGYNLGLVRDRGDRAMLAFLERQTGVSHTRFLQEAGDGHAAVEGLKRWLSRDGNVTWPLKDAAISEFKRAVINAQWLKLVELGDAKLNFPHDPLFELEAYAFRVAAKNGYEFFRLEDYDKVGAALGRRLRGALARAAGREGAETHQ